MNNAAAIFLAILGGLIGAWIGASYAEDPIMPPRVGAAILGATGVFMGLLLSYILFGVEADE